MRILNFLGATLAALLLAACGGTSTPPGPVQGLCELPLKYADGISSGYAIGTSPTLSVPRQFNTCAISQVQSASLGLCISHTQISELTAQLILPDNTRLALDLQNAPSSGTCLLTGQLLTMTLPNAALQKISGLRGNWQISVTDTNAVAPTPVGHLVGWSLSVGGLQ